MRVYGLISVRVRKSRSRVLTPRTGLNKVGTMLMDIESADWGFAMGFPVDFEVQSVDLGFQSTT